MTSILPETTLGYLVAPLDDPAQLEYFLREARLGPRFFPTVLHVAPYEPLARRVISFLLKQGVTPSII